MNVPTSLIQKLELLPTEPVDCHAQGFPGVQPRPCPALQAKLPGEVGSSVGREESPGKEGEGVGKGRCAAVGVCSESGMRSAAPKPLPGRTLGAQGRLRRPGAAGLPEAALDRQRLERSAPSSPLLWVLSALHALNS